MARGDENGNYSLRSQPFALSSMGLKCYFNNVRQQQQVIRLVRVGNDSPLAEIICTSLLRSSKELNFRGNCVKTFQNDRDY